MADKYKFKVGDKCIYQPISNPKWEKELKGKVFTITDLSYQSDKPGYFCDVPGVDHIGEVNLELAKRRKNLDGRWVYG